MTILKQCELLGLPRSTYYYQPRPESTENLRLLRELDQLYMERPFYGSRKMAVVLAVNRKRIQRLMRIPGIEAHYPKPNLSRPAPGHQIYPYLLRDVPILRPNQVWSTDITYIPMRGGFLYLVAVMDWFSRFVLSWELSNTGDGDRLRPGGPRCRLRLRPARDLELRSGSPVPFGRLPGPAQRARHRHQHGWTRSCSRQCLHRAPVAFAQVRKK